MNTTQSTDTEVTFHGQTFRVIRKGTKFVSFYSKASAPEEFLLVDHRSETQAQKGSWQSASMRNVWIYRGYVAV
jgi:hypothetical protein